MNSVELEKLPTYLQARRWFGGKAWPIKSVSVLEHAQLPNGRGTLAMVEVTYGLGSPERYVMPVVSDAQGQLQEALDHDDAARLLLSLIRDSATLAMGAGTVRGLRFDEKGPLNSLRRDPDVRRLSVEQSNTSIVFDEKVILKVIRKLEQGINPELEIGRFLAERTSFRNTPTLLGALDLEGTHSGTIGLLHQFVPSRGDGWSYATETFKRSPKLQPAFINNIKTLGETLGELHMALASEKTDPAFSPEPLLQEDLQRWSSSITGELGVTLADASKLPDLAARREGLVARAHKLAGGTASGEKIRVHGDLHLGQVLFTDQGWQIFDFEGEPARSYAQRREKHSPLKDVAGMLRSFAYAAAAAARNGGTEIPVSPLRESFLEGYLGATKGASFLPRSDLLRTLLEALEFEKVLYELRYELQNRPDWAPIPAAALTALAEP
ncbi:MAG: phosphotransferase [Myxococcaceae bacterium]